MKPFIRFTDKGIYCIPGRFYLDPWKPVNYSVISHGHADHARPGMKNYLCHHLTKPIIQHRLGHHNQIESTGYNETVIRNGVKISLHPAGHLIGSAQIRLEYKGQVVVFTGDYKVDADGLSTPFESVKAHTFITESTFGLPVFNWESNEKYRETLSNWVNETVSDGKTPVLIGYSLGKAQRIMKLLEGNGEMFVHSAIANLNEAISKSGFRLPDYQMIQRDKIKDLQGKIIILPPALIGSNLIKKIPNARTAVCSGWMQIRGNRRWRAVDAGFAISDHADWNGLITAVKASEAEKVFVTHGYESVFARYLNETGIEAYEMQTQYGQMEDNENPENESV